MIQNKEYMDKTVQQVHHALNHLYRMAKGILEEVTQKGMKATLGSYSGHYIKMNEQYEYQEYPIPVVIVENVGDIGINLDKINFEFFVKREELDELLVEELLKVRQLELYGGKDCLTDFYSKGDTRGEVMNKLAASDEIYIGIACYMSKEESAVEIITEFLRVKELLNK